MSSKFVLKKGDGDEPLVIPKGDDEAEYISRLMLDIQIHNRDHDDKIEILKIVPEVKIN